MGSSILDISNLFAGKSANPEEKEWISSGGPAQYRLPGTAETIVIPALEKSSGKKLGQDFGVCVNPEFMREGTAVADFLEPAMTVIGAADQNTAACCAKSTVGSGTDLRNFVSLR